MDYIESIVNDLDQQIIAEIGSYGIPTLEDYNDSAEIAVKLAKQLNADANLVLLASKLIHAKLGEAIKSKKVHEHANMAMGFAMEFFKDYPINDSIKQKVFSCIKEYRDKQFTCIESEICANAYCYKYLVPKKILKMFYNLKAEGYNFEEILLMAEEKVDEKWNLLTLDICKKELEENYKKIKEFIELSKHQKN